MKHFDFLYTGATVITTVKIIVFTAILQYGIQNFILVPTVYCHALWPMCVCVCVCLWPNVYVCVFVTYVCVYVCLWPMYVCVCLWPIYMYVCLCVAELGVHGVINQSQSRGDEKMVANPSTGLHSSSASYRSNSIRKILQCMCVRLL